MNKLAYLTIDDSPSAEMQTKLDALSARGIPAIWFCQGDGLEKHPEPVVEAIRKGYLIGNHSYSHPHFSELSLEAAYEQIRCTDVLIASLYAQAGVPQPVKYFRFPYGDKGGLMGSEVEQAYPPEGLVRKQALQTFLREAGYCPPPHEQITYRYYRQARLHLDVDWYWTYDVMEWSLFQPQPKFGIDSIEKVFARMDEDEPEGWRGLNAPGFVEIILLHDHIQTSEYFMTIVERLVAKGLTFVLPVPVV